MLAQAKFDAPTLVDAFVDAQLTTTLVTVGADGTPHVGYFPFVRTADGFELHLARPDEQLADLRERPRCTIAFHQALAFVPSHWTDAEDARHADAFHQSALFEGSAEVIDDPDIVAAHLTTLVARYQPEGSHRPIAPGDALYARSYAALAVVRVTIDRSRSKFKVGQQMAAETRANVASRLRERGRERDGEAAALSDAMARRT